MERHRMNPGVEPRSRTQREPDRSRSPARRAQTDAATSSNSSLIIGAKTLAGVGIGLVAVVAGSLALGVVAETVLVPSLLMKLAGGIAGGGVGMAKGLKDAQKVS